MIGGWIFAAIGVWAAAQTEPIQLFNGSDLDGWYAYTTEFQFDNPELFTVEGGMLHFAGGNGDKAATGGLITKRELENYRLVVEYKWGERTYGLRKDAARDSGIILHAVGPNGPAPWMTGIECQILEGGTGDIGLLSGPDNSGQIISVAATTQSAVQGGQRYFRPGGPKVTLNTGTINWYGKDPGWKDIKGFRGRLDVESPHGKWTRVECVCKGNHVTISVNGKVVTFLTNCSISRGKILLQSNGAEIYFRRVELYPLST